MAEETVDRAVQVCGLTPANGCVTKGLPLDGAVEWTPTLFIRLIQDFGMDLDVRPVVVTIAYKYNCASEGS